jgi:hypothetical protein
MHNMMVRLSYPPLHILPKHGSLTLGLIKILATAGSCARPPSLRAIQTDTTIQLRPEKTNIRNDVYKIYEIRTDIHANGHGSDAPSFTFVAP